ncbi:MAG: hypothetical protein GX801_08800 [Fibrobacter sp.]|nr:hypothetical protein [Fibrobacter sp.]
MKKYLILMLLIWFWGCSSSPSSLKNLGIPATQEALEKPQCTHWGTKWLPHDNFACRYDQKDLLFGSQHEFSQNEALTLKAKEQMIQDWFEDAFLRFSGYEIGTIPSFCSIDSHTACMETIIQDSQGNLTFWVGISDGKTLKMLWKPQKKPSLDDFNKFQTGQ